MLVKFPVEKPTLRQVTKIQLLFGRVECWWFYISAGSKDDFFSPKGLTNDVDSSSPETEIANSCNHYYIQLWLGRIIYFWCYI